VTRTILVVDDEPDLVANCERLLQRAGHESLRAHTGPDAISLIDRKRPDLVVADLRLPGMDGLTVARHARGQAPPIPVILITAYDSLQARTAARESGVGVYLPKPFSNAAFLEAVQRALAPKSTDQVAEG
jgi:two-component system nitrogen regulation response regulator GlnG